MFQTFRASALLRAVVHDGDSGRKRMHDRRRIGCVRAVMSSQVHVNLAEAVLRTYQGDFLLRRQISQVDRAELAIRKQKAYRS